MNVSQIGQKKKKQAVRRLSQGSGGQGNRKLDIRRKLEANRRVAVTGSTAGERRATRGNLKSAQTHESRASRPFSGGVKRILAHAQSASKRHASPLTSTASTISNKHEANAFLNPTATEVTQGNVFGSNVLKSSPTQETVSGMQQAKNNQESIFQSKGRPTLNQGNVFGSNRANNSTTFSALASDSRSTKSHPSPLTALTNSPSKAGGSIVSGVASKGNAENSNVSSLVNKYEDKTTQPSFQTTSSNMFPSSLASMNQSSGLQSIFPQSSVFSAEQHASLDPSKSAQIFGSSLNTISSSAPPNVNLFASNQAKPVPTTEHSTINITPFSGCVANPGNRVPSTENNVVNLEKRPGMFASTMQSPTKRSNVFNQSSNPVASTSPNTSINLNPIGSTNQTVMNQNSPLKKGSIFGNTANSTEQGNSARIFVMSNSTTANSETRDSNSDSKPNTFVSRPFSLSSASQSHTLFNTAGQTPPNPDSIFGTAGPSKTSGMFSTTQTSGSFSTGSKSTAPVFSQVSKPGTVFENVGSSSGQQESSGMFSSSKNPTLGPFSRKTSNAAVSSQPNSGSIFGSYGQVSTLASAGVFSKQSKATLGNVSAVPQTQESSRENSSTSERRKGPRRSLSNTDTSNLTSILIKDLREEYLDKKLLEREFAIFGQNKVTLQPSKQSAIVNFANHESAKEAKSKAAQLFPFKNAHVFWCKKKGTGRLSKTPEKPTNNKQEFRSRRRSISNALNNIDVSKLPPAMSAQERFTTLDEVDKRIRQAITPYRDIANAPVVVGVCCDMCPEKERYMREYQANLSIFEMIPGTQDNRDGDVPKVDHIKAVKEYSRSAADKLEPLSHELRPVHVLQMALDYLMTNVMDNSEEKRDEWFNFLWNRTRAIRKDITQQHLCDVQSVDLVEKITRYWHTKYEHLVVFRLVYILYAFR